MRVIRVKRKIDSKFGNNTWKRLHIHSKQKWTKDRAPWHLEFQSSIIGFGHHRSQQISSVQWEMIWTNLELYHQFQGIPKTCEQNGMINVIKSRRQFYLEDNKRILFFSAIATRSLKTCSRAVSYIEQWKNKVIFWEKWW